MGPILPSAGPRGSFSLQNRRRRARRGRFRFENKAGGAVKPLKMEGFRDTPGKTWGSPGALWLDVMESLPVFKSKQPMASNELPKPINNLISLGED